MPIPRVIIAGLAGGTGKTTVSLGVTRALTKQGLCVQPFKKGLDYADAAWLGLAAGRFSASLDLFMLDRDALAAHFCQWAGGAGIAIIEGNRGFFDGRDLAGSCSTADVAVALAAPVVLVVDCTKMTRTAAALVAGCASFPGGERIAGVILNNTANSRHRSITRRAVEDLAGVPVLGVLPRFETLPFMECSSGLSSAGEAEEAVLAFCESIALEYVDLAMVRRIACSAGPVAYCAISPRAVTATPGKAHIGIVRDAAFWQYYEENLAALRDAGAVLHTVSLLDDVPWPHLDGLYIGGGDMAPHMERLAANAAKLDAVREGVRSGMPVYAEQAGFVCLMESFSLHGAVYPLAGIFPVRAVACKKPQGLGYVEASGATLPFFASGMPIRGHEYHYIRLLEEEHLPWLLRRTIGAHLGRVWDGLAAQHCWGAFMQIFAPAAPDWAPMFVAAAKAYRDMHVV